MKINKSVLQKENIEETISKISIPLTYIRPSKGWVNINLKELWEYRELLYFFIWRDIKVRYKQTLVGAAWAIIQPFFTMVVFTIFFGLLAKIPSDGIPYPVFAYTTLVPWMYFSNAISFASNSLVEHQKVITKVYFPRLILPLSSVCSGLIDFSISFGILILIMLFYSIIPTIAILTLPLFILLTILTALSVSIWLSALNVEYRDVRYIIPFILQVWLFISPVAYPSSIVPEQFRVLYGLNPMTGVLEGFRWALTGKAQPPEPLLIVSTITVMLLLAGGLYYFRRMEKSFADVI